MRIFLVALLPLMIGMLGMLELQGAEGDDSAAIPEPPVTRQFYEIRQYTIVNEAGEAALDTYFKDAYLPAMKRQEVGPIGIFVSAPQDQNKQRRFVMITPVERPGVTFMIRQKLNADSEYREAAKEFMARENANPAYGRIVTELSVSMACMKSLVVPDGTLENPDRVYELRTYESANERLGDLKVKMFNAGEVPIFYAAGITPIFISQTVIGPQMPSLTYMSVFPNEDARLKAWEAFKAHPDWKILSAETKYQGTVSRIDKYVLVPKPYSQM